MSDYLCEELIVEIFTRLSPKSLLRFRSLSKSLYSCISSPDFIRMHTFRSPQKILFLHSLSDYSDQPLYTLHGEDELPLLLCPKRGYIGMTKTATFPRGTKFGTVGSCNGIFCLKNKSGLNLWNPSIRRKVSIPECPHSQEFEFPLGGIGFGFDPVSDDYKIVRISHARDTSFVYAVKTGSWCEIASSKPRTIGMTYSAFFFKGVLHWEVYFDIESHDVYGPSCILTFDLSTHVFGMIPSPGHVPDWLTTKITTIQDSLALISTRMNGEDAWIWVWRDASWSVFFKLGTRNLIIRGALQLQPKANKNGDLLISTITEGLQGLQICNRQTGVLSRVVDFNATSKLVGFQLCVETLHLLDVGETACETDQL